MESSSALSRAIPETLGKAPPLDPWGRPEIYREVASTAAENTLPYWAILILSGAIATLGLALNSAAVVIGAMLVAPLLAPVLGLALALAVGDGRLSVQIGTVVLASTVAVVTLSALLTVLLPFQTVTVEILARTRPTTLDLVIAVCSGLVGALVSVARGSRLSAALPGVAIAVALIPPLAVAGFGIGVGWNGELIRGSLLLYGANLAGIVLSGMVVFLLVGMHRPEVLEAARTWHREAEPHGLAAWADRLEWVRSLGVFRSPGYRVGLVLVFVVALGFPLTETLSEIARESRVERAVAEVAHALFEEPDHASILNRQVVYGTDRAQVHLRVATTRWFDGRLEEEFERRASALSGEPVQLSLEQLPTRGENLDQLAALFPAPGGGSAPPSAQGSPRPDMETLLASVQSRLRELAGSLALPDGTEMAGLELGLAASGAPLLRATYLAPRVLSAEAEQMLQKQLLSALSLPGMQVRVLSLPSASRPLVPARDSLLIRQMAETLGDHPGLQLELLLPSATPAARQETLRSELLQRGIPSERLRIRLAEVPGAQLRFFVAPPPTPSS